MSDETPLGHLDLRMARRLLGYLRPHRLKVGLALLLLVLTSVLELAGPYLVKLVIDVALPARDHALTLQYVGIFLGAVAALLVTEYWQLMLMYRVGQQVASDLRVRLLERLLGMSHAYHDRHPVGRQMTRVIGDVEILGEFFSVGLVEALGELLTLVAITAMLFWLEWRLALVALAALPTVLWMSVRFRQASQQAYRDVRSHLGALNGYLQESLNGMATIQTSCREEGNRRDFGRLDGQYLAAALRAIRNNALYSPGTDVLTTLVVALVLGIGGKMVLGGALTLGLLVAFVQYVDRFFEPVRALSDRYANLLSALAAAERIYALEDEEDPVRVPEAPETPRLEGRVAFRNVEFAYRPDQPVLRGIDLQVRPGETVAVVGPTGAGKTTLIGLLMRFYDVGSGAIEVDGVDLRRMDPLWLRSHVALVLQDVFLFSGTVLENLTMRRPEISPERAREAARAVGADVLVDRLPGGFDAVLSERGQGLSAGERQLLALARALAADAPVVVLDEATSNIDSETEARIQHGLETVLRGRTALVIAHRLSTVERADRIVVLDGGRIVEEGTHAELLEAGGLYRRLYELQFVEATPREGTSPAARG